MAPTKTASTVSELPDTAWKIEKQFWLVLPILAILPRSVAQHPGGRSRKRNYSSTWQQVFKSLF